jgi:DNA-binding XRE family transcriptional regulator
MPRIRFLIARNLAARVLKWPGHFRHFSTGPQTRSTILPFAFAFRGSRDHRPDMPEVGGGIFPLAAHRGNVYAMAVIRRRPPLTPFTLQQCRDALALSQASFAEQLGVSLETYRTWDSGRRPVRPGVLTRANELALRADPHVLLPIETLAALIHVHRRTLHAAAKDGRLRVTYDTRTTFRRLRAHATWADAEQFRHAYFDKAVWPKDTAPTHLDPGSVGLRHADPARALPARRSSISGKRESGVPRLCSGASERLTWKSHPRKRRRASDDCRSPRLLDC